MQETMRKKTEPEAGADRKDWEKAASDLLKEELRIAGLTYQGLADKLAAAGLQTSEGAIRVKLVRGTFSAAFLLECLAAIGSERLTAK
jgi:DNA-binding NarL/FixJ family response regulator